VERQRGGACRFIAFAPFVARPASVLLACTGVRPSRLEKLFIAWFGPKGIAWMLFALFILNSTAPDRTLIFDVAAFTMAPGRRDGVAVSHATHMAAGRRDGGRRLAGDPHVRRGRGARLGGQGSRAVNRCPVCASGSRHDGDPSDQTARIDGVPQSPQARLKPVRRRTEFASRRSPDRA
jgi:hypothetical protein